MRFRWRQSDHIFLLSSSADKSVRSRERARPAGQSEGRIVVIINERAPSVLLFIIPLSASAIFLLDILGPFAPYTSGLYVPLIMLSIAAFSPIGVAYTGLVCFIMTVAGFILSRNESFDMTTEHNLFAILCVVFATTAIAMVCARRIS